jgi:hypothetical protein
MYHLRRHMHHQSNTLLPWAFTITITTTQMPRQHLVVRRPLQAMSLRPAKLPGIITTNNNSRRLTTIPLIHLLAPPPIPKLKL